MGVAHTVEFRKGNWWPGYTVSELDAGEISRGYFFQQKAIT